MATDRPIGSTFEFNGKRYIVLEINECEGCAFEDDPSPCDTPDEDGESLVGRCTPWTRADGVSVIFVEVPKRFK